jgi:hypothetical protein
MKGIVLVLLLGSRGGESPGTTTIWSSLVGLIDRAVATTP